MNKVKLIADITKRQQSYWEKVDALYASALKKNYHARQCFDLKEPPVQSELPTDDWLEISRLIDTVRELEQFKAFVKAQKRGAKEEASEIEELPELLELQDVVIFGEEDPCPAKTVENDAQQGFIKFGKKENEDRVITFSLPDLDSQPCGLPEDTSL